MNNNTWNNCRSTGISNASFLNILAVQSQILIRLDSLARVKAIKPGEEKPVPLASPSKVRPKVSRKRGLVRSSRRARIVTSINGLLRCLGVTQEQVSQPRKQWASHRSGKSSHTFWLTHNQHELLTILRLARMGWISQLKLVYPRTGEGDAEQARVLNRAYENVKRLFKARGVTLGE